MLRRRTAVVPCRLVLALAGGAAGLASSFVGALPISIDFAPTPDARVIVATLTFAVASTVMFALWPATRLARTDVVPELKQQTGDHAERGRRWFSGRNVLVVAQIALSLGLLTAGGLFLRSAIGAASAEPGFPFRDGLVASLDPSLAGYDQPRGRQIYRDLLESAADDGAQDGMTRVRRRHARRVEMGVKEGCMTRRIAILVIFGVFLLFSRLPAARQAPSGVAIEKIFAAIGVTEGATVCEVGAGTGEVSVAAARLVGSSGRVYTNELGEDRVKTLRSRTAAVGLGQITVVAGDPLRTNFPDAACDAVFMRDVYHHFTDPAAMNASIAVSLKPGGRLAVVDFGPNGREASTAADRANSKSHGVGADTVSRELKAAGLDVVSVESGAQRWLMVVARKPRGGSAFVPGV